MPPLRNWKYRRLRRFLTFVERSLDRRLRWVVFEPNDAATWARVSRIAGRFLNRLWRSGELRGVTANQAWFVRCDRTTMTRSDIESGRLILVVGVSPLRPAEFVILRIEQLTRRDDDDP